MNVKKYDWYLIHRKTGLILGAFGLVTARILSIHAVGPKRMPACEIKKVLFERCKIKGLRDTDFKVHRGFD